jgi:pyruvate dehydrogenase E1 component alpha subunit
LTTPDDGADRSHNSPSAPSTVRLKPSSATVLEHGSAPSLTPEQELEAYRQMLLIRRFEEKAGQLYGMGLIGGFCHLYIGQEAVVTGMQMAREEGIRSSPLSRPRAYACLRHGPQRRDG